MKESLVADKDIRFKGIPWVGVFCWSLRNLLCFVRLFRTSCGIAMLDYIINTNERWEMPCGDFIELDDGTCISVRPCWGAVKGRSFLDRMKYYDNLARFWGRFAEEDPVGFARYERAGCWITPEEGERIYGDSREA